MAQINFGGVEEKVVTREEFPLEKAREVLRDETIAVIGYGVQGPGQSLNLRLRSSRFTQEEGRPPREVGALFSTCSTHQLKCVGGIGGRSPSCPKVLTSTWRKLTTRPVDVMKRRSTLSGSASYW